MATQTTKRGLRKPTQGDYVHVLNDISANMENLDNAVPDTRKVNDHSLTGDFNITKSDVGLGNVDNTSDANKPISTATQTALNSKMDSNLKGAANGVAELDANGKVKMTQLPVATLEETRAMISDYWG